MKNQQSMHRGARCGCRWHPSCMPTCMLPTHGAVLVVSGVELLVVGLAVLLANRALQETLQHGEW